MKSSNNPRIRRLALMVFLAMLPALGGCAVVSVGGAGLSVGASAVRTTGKVAGAAVDVTSSAVHVSGSTSDGSAGGGTESAPGEP